MIKRHTGAGSGKPWKRVGQIMEKHWNRQSFATFTISFHVLVTLLSSHGHIANRFSSFAIYSSKSSSGSSASKSSPESGS
jgi:hypothetical protein